MHIMDLNGYRRQVLDGVGGVSKSSPDTVRDYGTPSATGQKTGQLDAKTRELIAIAVAVTLRREGGVTVHTDAAENGSDGD